MVSVRTPDGRELELPAGRTIQELMEELQVNEQTVIIKRNGVITHPEVKLRSGDRVEFVGIIFGG